MSTGDQETPNQALHRIFTQVDHNETGFVDFQGLCKLMALVNQDIDADQASRLMLALDRDGDGLITFEDFISVFHESSSSVQEENGFGEEEKIHNTKAPSHILQSDAPSSIQRTITHDAILEENETLRLKVAELTQLNHIATAKNQHLSDHLTKADSRVASLTDEFEALRKKYDDCRKQLTKAVEVQSQLEDQNKDSFIKIESLEHEMDALRRENAKNRSASAKEVKQISDFSSENDRLILEERSLRNANTVLTARVKALERHIEESLIENTRLKEDIESGREAFLSCKQDIDLLTKQVSFLSLSAYVVTATSSFSPL
eukprot:TRINITY_DN11464_c0_g1_i7.p1 TRINITY_DN11464_c0_g1~~TRINITY_DN11464_c0_g1_i7.p1  ORF type:complete len:318 (-),score=72.78 TRINITY_DN11464_c0_g1_i7:2-955(-)